MPYYSADKGDQVEVYLDGVLQQYVLDCDTDEGWLRKVSEPPQLDEKNNLVYVRHEGKVEVVPCHR